MSASDAGADGCQRKAARFMPESGGRLRGENGQWLPEGAVGAEWRKEKWLTGRGTSASDAGADGCQRKAVRFMPEGGGRLQKERSPEDAAEGSTEQADGLGGERAGLADL